MAMLTRVLAITLAALVYNIAVEPTVAAQTAPPATKAAPSGHGVNPVPGIEFYLARGESNACGPGCSEWIAAEGKIDSGAAQRLRRLLAKLGRARPPIYLYSPGGSIVDALELGRLIRGQKLDTTVGHTIPLSCDRDKPAEDPCERQKRSAQALESTVNPGIAECNSSCVYALVGGAVRLVPPSAKLGIHDVGLDPTMTLPRGARIDEAKRIAHERIQEYLREMGIDEGLFRAAAAIPFESKRYLERDEIARFGIDKREFGETQWWFSDTSVPQLNKSVFVRTDDDQHKYVDGFITVGCGAGYTLFLTLARQRTASETSDTEPQYFSLSVNGRRVALDHKTSSLFNLEQRSAWPSADTFEAVDSHARIALSPADFGRIDESAEGMPLDMAGFSVEYAKLRKRCNDLRRNAFGLVPTANPTVNLNPK
jgi:hypothetical protein